MAASDTSSEGPADAKAAHDYHGSGPHGGTIAEWGDGDDRIEFTVDRGIQESAVYILGSDAKTPTPVKAGKVLLSITEPVFQVELAPQLVEGEAKGMSSRFVGRHDNLGVVQEFAGRIGAALDGTRSPANSPRSAKGMFIGS